MSVLARVRAPFDQFLCTHMRGFNAARHRAPRRSLRRDRRCAVTMELAIIAIPFFAFLLVTMELSYDLFVQASLDNAVSTAARQAQIGSKTGTAGETSADYVKKSVCPALSGLLDCNALTVAVQPLPTNDDYYTAPTLTYAQAGASGGSICTGTGGEVMQIAAWYAGPSFVGLLVPSFTTSLNGRLVHLAHSSAAYVNEYFSGGQTSGTGC